MKDEFNLYTAVLARFLRGFVAGFFATAATMTFYAANLGELKTFVAMLVLSSIVGGIAGGILAADKYIRSKPDDFS